MNNTTHKLDVKKAVSGKFRGHKRLLCKVTPIYPRGAEREFQRLTEAYMRLLGDSIKENLLKFQDAMEPDGDIRSDGVSDQLAAIQRALSSTGLELQKKTESFNLRQKLESFANRTRKLTIREWKKAVRVTLGIDILEDYYSGEFYREAMETWINKNIDLITRIPRDALGEMRTLVQEAYKTGAPTPSIAKEIQEAYGISKSRARLLARDQIAKLNSDLARQQQKDAGVNEYTWSSSGDGRVRKGHKKLNGKRFSWNDPPVVDERTGRRAHPGEDYQCRCVALPVFELETLDVPINEKKNT